ncbi:TPA: hypothetical protein ACU967_004317 [Burkholderia contaminans]|uniref:hypothetical protein n=1 Tax=Pseudomonadota TaxID=1224 RepID=UPI0005EA436B|nr:MULTISPECIES: hypothetical protein [Pseudomonadota]MBM6430502.1 hypothetical protein [Burkholderia contaminans]MCA7880085.1 hypothetical protein [Burkholderia contaminans]MDN8024884.1 hypothetical protein [Burkholderia contaminans]GAO23976.1 putative hydantoinase [Alicycliphilus sp. B1]
MWRVILGIDGDITNIFSLKEAAEEKVTTKVLTTKQERSIVALLAIEDCGLNGLGYFLA